MESSWFLPTVHDKIWGEIISRAIFPVPVRILKKYIGLGQSSQLGEHFQSNKWPQDKYQINPKYYQ